MPDLTDDLPQPPDERLGFAIVGLGALAHDVRLRAFRLLVKAGPTGMASGDIADALQVPPTGMSFHLANLERAGLVRRGRDAGP